MQIFTLTLLTLGGRAGHSTTDRRCILRCKDRSRRSGEPRAQPLTFGHLIATSGLRIETMLWTIFVILLVLWLLGVVTSYTLGGFIHILLVVAIAVVLINVITGRRAI
jgi:hypothetical protein